MASSAIVTKSGISYRFLEKSDDWSDFNAEHILRGVDAPDARLTRVAVAEDAGGDSSYFYVSPQMHCSLILNPQHRGTKVLVNLIAMIWTMIEQHLKTGVDVFIVADEPETAKMCEAAGMERVLAPVYVRRVRKPGMKVV